jgi:spoIIIJ-associated protein
MRSIEVEGKTTKEAINLALQKLGVTRDKVHIKILSEGHRGLFGMEGLKLAKVKVTLKEETHQIYRKA